MGEGYQVIYDDLGNLAGAFSSEAGTFAALHPRMAPAPVDGGDATVNAGIAAVLSLFGGLNASISVAMVEHGTKLCVTHGDYKANDSDVVALYNRVIGEA